MSENTIRLFVGCHRAWDARCFPRLMKWPLPPDEEQELFEEYSAMIQVVYTSFEAWRRNRRRHDECCDVVEFHGETLPPEVFVVLGAYPERITWSGERAPYRADIQLAFMPGGKPAFVSYKEAEQIAEHLAQQKPDCRFAVVKVPVRS